MPMGEIAGFESNRYQFLAKCIEGRTELGMSSSKCGCCLDRESRADMVWLRGADEGF